MLITSLDWMYGFAIPDIKTEIMPWSAYRETDGGGAVAARILIVADRLVYWSSDASDNELCTTSTESGGIQWRLRGIRFPIASE